MEAAILNDVTSRPRTDRTVSSNYMESDDTLEYTVSPSGVMSASAASQEEEVEWRRTAHCSVLPVRCKKLNAELVKSRFGSGSKGRSIRVGKLWLTPTEFEVYSGRRASKDWKRSIKFRGRPLQLMIEAGLLSVHSVTCCCAACLDDPVSACPVKLLQPYKRRKKAAQDSPQDTLQTPLIQILASASDGSGTQTINLPASIQLGLNLPNIDLNGGNITIPIHQPLSENESSHSLSPGNSKSNSLVLPLSTIISNNVNAQMQEICSSHETNMISSQLPTRGLSLPLSQTTSSLTSSNVPGTSSRNRNTILLPLIPDNDDAIIPKQESSMILSDDTIELSFNPNEDSDEEGICLGVAPSGSMESFQKVTLQLSSNKADAISIDDVSISNNPLQSPTISYDESEDFVKHTIREADHSSGMNIITKIISPNEMNDTSNKSRSFHPNVIATPGYSTFISNSTAHKINSASQDEAVKKEINTRVKETTSQISDALNKFNDVLTGIERGVTEARMLLTNMRTWHLQHNQIPDVAGVQAHLTSLLTRHETSSVLLEDKIGQVPLDPCTRGLETRGHSHRPSPPHLVMSIHAYGKKCINCNRDCRLQCSGCESETSYCSPFCQRKDWPSHQHDCRHAVAQAEQQYIYVAA